MANHPSPTPVGSSSAVIAAEVAGIIESILADSAPVLRPCPHCCAVHLLADSAVAS